jgi:phage terminase large subunit-like protein
MSDIETTRVSLRDLPPLVRIVVGVDPATSTNENSDETGIICAGIGENGDFYVLDDASGVMSPYDWGKEAISLYRARRADRIVAERNQGGEMVSHTLRSIDPNVPITLVWAAKGKAVRAEPIAALYEQHRVHHCGMFNRLAACRT